MQIAIERAAPLAQFDLVCLVDTQPEVGNYSLAARAAPELVIDHHPARPASLLSAFHDVGGPAGATVYRAP